MDKIITLTLALFIGIAGMSSAGCSTQPMPNINIGGGEGCPPGDVTINLIVDTDKAIVGDEGKLNDSDTITPDVGL